MKAPKSRLASKWGGIDPRLLNRAQRQEYRADAQRDLREHGVRGYRAPLAPGMRRPDVYGVTVALPMRRSKEQRRADWHARHEIKPVESKPWKRRTPRRDRSRAA